MAVLSSALLSRSALEPVAVFERPITNCRVVDTGRETEKRILPFSRVGAGIAPVRCWENRSRRWRKRKAGEGEGDEKNTAPQGRVINQIS